MSATSRHWSLIVARSRYRAGERGKLVSQRAGLLLRVIAAGVAEVYRGQQQAEQACLVGADAGRAFRPVKLDHQGAVGGLRDRPARPPR